MRIIWRDAGVAVSGPISFGSLAASDSSALKTLSLEHDSLKALTNCGFYLTPSKHDYIGSRYPQWDYDQIMWYGNNYNEFGLSLMQTYSAVGIAETYGDVSLRDFGRTEEIDIFAGSVLEILDGSFAGETSVIESYNPDTHYFILETPFSGDVTNSNYGIEVTKTDYFKQGVGASFDSQIPLLNRAGIIERNEVVDINFAINVPSYAFAPSKLLVDLNLNFRVFD